MIFRTYFFLFVCLMGKLYIRKDKFFEGKNERKRTKNLERTIWGRNSKEIVKILLLCTHTTNWDTHPHLGTITKIARTSTECLWCHQTSFSLSGTFCQSLALMWSVVWNSTKIKEQWRRSPWHVHHHLFLCCCYW